MCKDGIDGSFQRANDGIQEPLDGIAIFPTSRPVLPFESRPADHRIRQLTFISAARVGLRSYRTSRCWMSISQHKGDTTLFGPKSSLPGTPASPRVLFRRSPGAA